MLHSNSSYSVLPCDADVARETALMQWQHKESASRVENGESLRKYQWFYLRNPAGRALTYILQSGDGCNIGFLGVGCRELSAGGLSLRGGVLVDYVIQPEHRSGYPAMLLQRRAHESVLQHLDLVYGMPNVRAEPVLRRLRYQKIGLLVRTVKVLCSRGYLARKLPEWIANLLAPVIDSAARLSGRIRFPDAASYDVRLVDGPDDDFDELWKKLDKQHLIIGHRDRQFLRWRFGECPNKTFEFLVVRRGDNAALVGYAVLEMVSDVAHVRDWCMDVKPAKVGSALLAIGRFLRERACTSISMEVLAPAGMMKSLDRAGFVTREKRSVFCTMSEQVRRQLMGREWFMTDADEDM